MAGSNYEQIGSYFRGDDNTEDFTFEDFITPSELLTLFITSDPVNKACLWLTQQMMAAGWRFKSDGPFMAQKRGKDYEFPSFTDWFHWCMAYTETIVAVSWAELFSSPTLMIGYRSEEEPSTLNKKPYYDEIEPNPADPITKWEAVYPYLEQNGYRIEDEDDDGPTIYCIHKRSTEPNLYEPVAGLANPTEEEVYYVHKSRVVEFCGIRKEMGRKCTSKAQLYAHIAVVQRQMIRSYYAVAKNLCQGMIVGRADTPEEATTLNSKVDEGFSGRTRVWTSRPGPLEDVIKLVMPEFKVSQYSELMLNLDKLIGSATSISIRYMGHEDIASGLGDGGAGISHINTKFEIKERQRHYKRAIEEVFYLMGKEDTEFEWNDPMVKDEEMSQAQNDQSPKSDAPPAAQNTAEVLPDATRST